MSANRIRTCIGCRIKKNKHLMRRMVLDDRGVFLFDEKQRLPGRGGYVCFNDQCIALALKRRDLSRVFKNPVKGVNLGSLGAQVEVMTACQK
ncbi:MAG TPA: YlxR family protein [Proteobacteria bacterium]|nr:YlxR family protein [Pseudomonadota bacterium]